MSRQYTIGRRENISRLDRTIGALLLTVVVDSTGAVDSHYWQGFGFGVTVEPGQTVEGTLSAILNSRSTC